MTEPFMKAEYRDTQSDTWTATDALGRTLPGFEDCGPTRKGRFVGIFYFLWLERRPGQGLYDISRLLAANPDNPQYGPEHAFHWWGEPHFGYYVCDDEFVIRKHAQMLADAGVDMICFDVTNALIYEDNYLAICRVFQDMRMMGQKTPRLAFLTNSRSAEVVHKLYDRFYSKGLYPDLWFRWKGKPLILAPQEGLSQKIKDFFTIRQSWAWTSPKGWFGDGRDKWPWVDHYPQKPGWHESPDKPEQIAVSVAQHPVSNIGRSFHDGRQPPLDQRTPEKGLCFAEQWRRALEVDPEFIFITGWNEWIAQRFVKSGDRRGPRFLGEPLEPGETYFVDQYNQEYSRDIEPMRGGHIDNYYYQMVDGIRRFKGVRPRPDVSGSRTIRINADFSQWQDVGPEFLDDLDDTAHRNHPGWGSAGPYVNTKGRNDFDLMKVARDDQNLYFYARTREPITKPDSNWMLLLLNTDGDPQNGWEGYDFIVNRKTSGKRAGILERSMGGWNWETVAEVKLEFAGNDLHLAIPRAALGLEKSKGLLRLDFKWADNVPGSGDIMDFIDKGDVAPNGRFSYRYEE